jgi:hypothetical protein
MTPSCRTNARLAAVVALLALTGPCLCSQTKTDPTPLLRSAIEKGQHAVESKTRFTYLLQDHTQNFNKKGKLTWEVTRLYDVIYIADREYQHLLEINGKPLTGRYLADEQKRNDDAVRERTALDADARAKLMHYKHKDASVDIDQLDTDYQSRIVELTQLNGRDCLLLDAVPLATATDTPNGICASGWTRSRASSCA